MTPLSRRQAEVAERIAKGMSDKAIAHDMGLSINTIRNHVREAASRIPGPSYPRHRLTLFYFGLEAEDDAAPP